MNQDTYVYFCSLCTWQTEGFATAKEAKKAIEKHMREQHC